MHTDDTPYSYYPYLYKNNRDNTFSLVNLNLPIKQSPQITIADFDNDNDIDILRSGASFGSVAVNYMRIYKNDYPINSFSELADFNLMPTKYGMSACADYDNDGDIDILTSTINQNFNLQIYSNNLVMKSGSFSKNNKPKAPTAVEAIITPDQLLVKWNKVIGDETSNLTYNVSLKCDNNLINHIPRGRPSSP